MADDRRDPRDPAQGAGEPDRTQQFDPFADEDAERGGEPAERAAGPADADRPDDTIPLGGDETVPLPPGGRTMPLPRPDETAPLPRPDTTARLPRPEPPSGDETAYLPGGDATRRLRGGGGAWAGRAEVPPRGGAPVRDPAPAEWEPGDEDGRRWWLPIMLGLVALLLLAMLGLGVWLILRAREGGGGPVLPSPSPSATTATTPAPTSAPPTTAQPTPSVTTVAPVRVPPVLGLPEADARRALDDVGLVYRLQYRESDQPPGTVIGTDPPPNAAVPPGTVVTLVIAVPQRSTTPAPTGSPGATPTR